MKKKMVVKEMTKTAEKQVTKNEDYNKIKGGDLHQVT